MSTKKRYIQTANLISEQRYLTKKFINEDETPQPITQTNLPQVTQTTEDLTNMGVNVTDTATQQSIIQQLQPHSDKINLGELQNNLGKKEFFDVLGKYVNLSPEHGSKIEKANNPNQPKTITGEEAAIKIGNLTFKGTFDLKDKNVGDIGLHYKTKVGNTPTTLMLKAKDPGSIGSGDFGLQNVQAGVKVNIPHNTNKYKGNML